MVDIKKQYIGIITKLIHPQCDGFIKCYGRKIYFNCSSHLFVKKRTWQIGDKVTFRILEKTKGKKYAKITSFIENPIYEDFRGKAANENNPIIIRGKLKSFDCDLYFEESQSRLLFSIYNLTASDVNLSVDKEYEAILNAHETFRKVILVERENLVKKLKLINQRRETLNSTILEVRNDYLKVSIPGTALCGKVLVFDRTKDYKVGDDLELLCFLKKNGKYILSDVNYCRSKETFNHLPRKGELYQAVITGCDKRIYNIKIIGNSIIGIIPTIFRNVKLTCQLEDVINVIYNKRSRDLRYLFLSTQQYARKEELKAKRKKHKMFY